MLAPRPSTRTGAPPRTSWRYRCGTSLRLMCAVVDELGSNQRTPPGPTLVEATSLSVGSRRSRCCVPYHWIVAKAPPMTASTARVNGDRAPGAADGSGARWPPAWSWPGDRGGAPGVRVGPSRVVLAPAPAARSGRPRRSAALGARLERTPTRPRPRRRRRPRRRTTHGDVVPPAVLVGQAHQLGGRLLGVGQPAQHRRDLVGRHLVEQPVAAQQERSPRTASTGQGRRRPRSSMPSARVTMLRCGWTSASSSRELPVAEEVLDQAVVLGELGEVAVAEQVERESPTLTTTSWASSSAPSASSTGTIAAAPAWCPCPAGRGRPRRRRGSLGWRPRRRRPAASARRARA